MLSDRQILLLKAIINEYIESAQPVGSSLIVKKYNIRYSPATVRNEMAKLLDRGYLEMLHTSSGRIPTTTAIKFFLEELMEEEQMDVLNEVALKQKLWSNRYNTELLLREAILSLTEMTQELTHVILSNGFVTYAGTVNLLDHPEFYEKFENAKTILNIIDHPPLIMKVFDKISGYENGITYLIGEEIGGEKYKEISIVISPIEVNNHSGHISVWGPARMNFGQVIPAVKQVSELVCELCEV